jgi:large subunit ribosomal protein L13
MSTTFAKNQEIERRWFVVDADGQVLGRLASRIARILSGKHKAIFTPHLDTGDHVIVVNAAKVTLTGNKEKAKLYFRHSGYPGGIKRKWAGLVRGAHPERLIEQAVRGMLPKTRLGRAQLKKLKVYAGPDHPHQAQQPRALDPAGAEAAVFSSTEG